MPKRGSRAQVWAGTHERTAGGLRKEDLIRHPKTGRIMSRKRSEAAKKKYKGHLDKYRFKKKSA